MWPAGLVGVGVVGCEWVLVGAGGLGGRGGCGGDGGGGGGGGGDRGAHTKRGSGDGGGCTPLHPSIHPDLPTNQTAHPPANVLLCLECGNLKRH